MKAYILGIVGAVLLSTVLSIILPDGKIGKQIQGVGKLLTVLFLITPIVTFIHDRSFSFLESDVEYDSSFVESSTTLASRREAKHIKAQIETNYSVTVDVVMNMSADGSYRLEKILVKIVDFGINVGQDHIDITTQIANELRSEYNCEIEVVI